MQLLTWSPQDQTPVIVLNPDVGYIDRSLLIPEETLPTVGSGKPETYYSLNNKVYYNKEGDFVSSQLSEKEQYLTNFTYPQDISFGIDYTRANNRKLGVKNYRNGITYCINSQTQYIRN
jgi:hypothetical protein